MRKKILPLVAALLFPLIAGAEETKPIIRFSPFFTQGVGIEETRFIESLIQSYLSDVGEVINFFSDSAPASSISGGVFPDSLNKTPDYVISGSIYLEKDNRVFTLEIFDTRKDITTRTTSSHKTASDLVLKARSLVESVFAVPAETVKIAAVQVDSETGESPERITENSITGTWRGENGIEMIRLQQGGRGIAFFSSGAQMSLSYKIEDNVLKVTQNSPNMERFYYPLPYMVAKQLSAEAEPMRWELLLYSGGAHLKGVRISTEAKFEGNAIVELLPESKRNSVWVRSAR